LCVHLGKHKNTYHISAPFRKKFHGDFEAEIGAFILTGDPDTFTYSSYGAGFMAGAAVENACAALGRDCGNYYNTVFSALAAMTGGLGGAYPPPGLGPGSVPNTSVPNSVRSDLGDPDCPGCGYTVPWTTAPGGWEDYTPTADQKMVADAFDGTPQPVTTTTPLTAYKYSTNSPTGRVYWVTIDPNLSPDAARASLALPNTNTGRVPTRITIPAGTTMLIGPVSGQTGNPLMGPYATGGGFQIYIPNGVLP